MMVMRKLISKNDKSVVVEVRTHDLTIRFDNGMFITISSPNSYYTKTGVNKLNEIVNDVLDHFSLTIEDKHYLRGKYGIIGLYGIPCNMPLEKAIAKLPNSLSLEEEQ